MSKNQSNLHDDLLFHMLKECKTLPIFLDQIFGFLNRRTDFYHVAKDPNSPVGLPKGLAESLLKHTFLKWRPDNEDATLVLQENDVPPVVVEEVVISSEDTIEDIRKNMENIDIGGESSNQPVTSDQSNLDSKCLQNADFTNSESYNGAAYENYCWSQTIVDVDVVIKVPESITSKDLKISILTKKISVKIKEQTLLEGELCQKCKHNDAIWSLDKSKLQIHLDKCHEMWWDCLVTSESKLDLSKIDCSRPFEELPEEAQVKIEELGWNQERKRLGLPTSDELEKQELLKKAWNTEGSPFSGPFDPSQVVFH